MSAPRVERCAARRGRHRCSGPHGHPESQHIAWSAKSSQPAAVWTESTPPGRAWGRARFPHTKPVRLDDGRWLATRQVAAHLSGRDVDLIRKLVPPVAYDVSGHHGHEPSPSCLKCQKTAPALVDMDEVEKALAGRPFADRKRRTPLRLE